MIFINLKTMNCINHADLFISNCFNPFFIYLDYFFDEFGFFWLIFFRPSIRRGLRWENFLIKLKITFFILVFLQDFFNRNVKFFFNFFHFFFFWNILFTFRKIHIYIFHCQFWWTFNLFFRLFISSKLIFRWRLYLLNFQLIFLSRFDLFWKLVNINFLFWIFWLTRFWLILN